MLLSGSSSLRLDENGFEITLFFAYRKKYRWREVSDIKEGSILGKSRVVFKAETQHLDAYAKFKSALTGRLNVALASGSNGYLPDNYGMSAVDLAQLMSGWRSSSTTGRNL